MEGDDPEAPALPQPPPLVPDQVSEVDAATGGVDATDGDEHETLPPKPTSPVSPPEEEMSPSPDLSGPESTTLKGQTSPSPPEAPFTAVETANGNGSCDVPVVHSKNPPTEPDSPGGKDPSAAAERASSSSTRPSPVHAPNSANGGNHSEVPNVPREFLPEDPDGSGQEKDAKAVDQLAVAASDEREDRVVPSDNPPSEPDSLGEKDPSAAAETASSAPTRPSPVHAPKDPRESLPEDSYSSDQEKDAKAVDPLAAALDKSDDPVIPSKTPPAEQVSSDNQDPNAAETTSSSPVTAPKLANGGKQTEDPDNSQETPPEDSHGSDNEKSANAVDPLVPAAFASYESEEEEAEAEAEARRLMSLAQDNYQSSDLKSALKHAKRAHRLFPTLKGLAQMLAALRVLRAPASDHYRVLRVEPFSHYSSIRAQYKALALLLHPDKSHPGPLWTTACEEAFKRISEALRVLSDNKARKDYDLKVRMELQRSRENGGKGLGGAKTGPIDEDGGDEFFWTTCEHCGLSQDFQRKYAGHQLVCTGCGESFLAVEREPDHHSDEEAAVDTNNNMRPASPVPSASPPTKRAKPAATTKTQHRPPPVAATTKSRSVSRRRIPGNNWRAPKTNVKRKAPSPSPPPSPTSSLDLPPPSKRRPPPKEPTLADMQREAVRLSKAKRIRPSPEKKGKEKTDSHEGKEKKKQDSEKEAMVVIPYHQLESLPTTTDIEPRPVAMAVEDSDFYDFDNDRIEKSFRKGQVWAIYDDDGGMPRHYGLIDEVWSTNAFEIKMQWLDLQYDKSSLHWELETGCHISCGRFKATRKVEVSSINMFSHVVDCHRVAKEMYRIYPRKGSVWALYSESTMCKGQERRYDIVVALTNCTNTFGVSVGYLEKVEGFKTVFKRREIGADAVKSMNLGEAIMFSHQVPARKLTGKEAPGLPEECWELDPASLPAELLTTTWMG